MKPLTFQHDGNMKWQVEAQTLTADRYYLAVAGSMAVPVGARFVRVAASTGDVWLRGQADTTAVAAPSGAITNGTAPDYLPAGSAETYSIEGEAYIVTSGPCLLTFWTGAS